MQRHSTKGEIMKTTLALFAAMALLLAAPLTFAQVNVPPGSTPVTQTATMNDAAMLVAHSHTQAATLTLTSAPNQYVYVTGMDISNCETGTAVAAGSPAYITTTGLSGSPQYQVGTGPATAGTCSPTQTFAFAKPLKAQAIGTNVTFVLPASVANRILSVNVYYFVAP